MSYKSKPNAMPTHPSARSGFSLIEVVAAIFIITMIITGVLATFSRTIDKVIRRSYEERAVAVAQRRMEFLLATGQEPEGADLQGRDEVDEDFLWEMRLKRVTMQGELPKPDLSNTVIEAQVDVTYDGYDNVQTKPFTLVRYFSILKPLPGQSIAVPLDYTVEEPQWYLDLKGELGREPTAEETFKKMSELGMLPPGVIDMLQMDDDTLDTDLDDQISDLQ